ncbi:hypothetical protein, partial [Propylenella binzhouense]|uniref:hypothetical protein n=1 Tax=Propylenella binzhouense TaxID=2555902 RepID=UPI001967B6CB
MTAILPTFRATIRNNRKVPASLHRRTTCRRRAPASLISEEGAGAPEIRFAWLAARAAADAGAGGAAPARVHACA